MKLPRKRIVPFTNKYLKMQQIFATIHKMKKYDKEDFRYEEISEPLKSSKKYFNADGEIYSWESKKNSAVRENIMIEESILDNERKRHIMDIEYDKGKTKKIKDKSKRKFEGLKQMLDNIQRSRETTSNHL